MRQVIVFKIIGHGADRKREQDFTGMWHQWGTLFEEFETCAPEATVGIVERPDGTITTVVPELLQFVGPLEPPRPQADMLTNAHAMQSDVDLAGALAYEYERRGWGFESTKQAACLLKRFANDAMLRQRCSWHVLKPQDPAVIATESAMAKNETLAS